MKWALCGGLDVPEWLLQEARLLATVSALKLRTIANALTHDDQHHKAQSLLAAYEPDDATAIHAALLFILEHAVRHNVDDATLVEELLQLGLPREHADGLLRVLRERRDALASRARARTLRWPQLLAVDWRVIAQPRAVEMTLRTQEYNRTPCSTSQLQMRIYAETLALLSAELKAAEDAASAAELALSSS